MTVMKNAPDISGEASKKSKSDGLVYVSTITGSLPDPAGVYLLKFFLVVRQQGLE